jgi:hypothetical protein
MYLLNYYKQYKWIFHSNIYRNFFVYLKPNYLFF